MTNHRTGGFSDLADEIEDLMLEYNWINGWQEKNVPDRCHSTKLYQSFTSMAADFDKREAVGVSSLLNLGLNEYKKLVLILQNLLRKLLHVRD